MYDTIIIGAGFAGLAAAKALREQGQDNFLVIEARDRVGGRTKPGQIAGLDIDLGGMWLGPTQTRLKAWGEELQVQTFSTPMQGKGCFRINGKDHHGEGEDFDGLFNLLEGTDYLSVRRKFKKLMGPLDCEAPWDHPQAAELDAMTVEQWLVANVRTKRLRILYRLICFSLFCAESSQMSMLFFLHYVKSGDGFDIILSALGDGAQRYLFHGSVHRIARKIGEELGDRLHLSEPVRGVKWDDTGVEVKTDKSSYRARNAIIAVPAPLLNKVDFTPDLPMRKAAFHNRMSMGSAIKYWIAYDRPFWRDKGLNGMILVDDYPCSPCLDVTPPGQEKGIIAGFFDGNHALDFSDQGTEARRDLLVDMLARHFGEEARNYIEYVDNDWTAEQWSGGCYGAYAPPGMFAKYGQVLREPIGPIHWAGTETSARWTGYIDGAIRSGDRAAAEIMKKEMAVAAA